MSWTDRLAVYAVVFFVGMLSGTTWCLAVLEQDPRVDLSDLGDS
jgi:hypothetical protein